MYKNIATQQLRNPLHTFKNIEADVLRLDLFHPVISGNKWFKLKYHLEESGRLRKKGLVSFGGAYSNHLTAMAFACREFGLLSAGIIRGEQPQKNHSLESMEAAGMNLFYVRREDYKYKDRLQEDFLKVNGDFYPVPEGGGGSLGVKGAEEILNFADHHNYSHIICSVGTGTTLAGIINSSTADQKVIGIAAVKISSQINNDLAKYVDEHTKLSNYTILYDYHFGGFAKYNEELIKFMNDYYLMENIPTDFVYTGKLFYAVEDLVKNDYFPAESKLLIIHSGGLQGNLSLEPGTLHF